MKLEASLRADSHYAAVVIDQARWPDDATVGSGSVSSNRRTDLLAFSCILAARYNGISRSQLIYPPFIQKSVLISLLQTRRIWRCLSPSFSLSLFFQRALLCKSLSPFFVENGISGIWIIPPFPPRIFGQRERKGRSRLKIFRVIVSKMHLCIVLRMTCQESIMEMGGIKTAPSFGEPLVLIKGGGPTLLITRLKFRRVPSRGHKQIAWDGNGPPAKIKREALFHPTSRPEKLIKPHYESSGAFSALST